MPTVCVCLLCVCAYCVCVHTVCVPTVCVHTVCVCILCVCILCVCAYCVCAYCVCAYCVCAYCVCVQLSRHRKTIAVMVVNIVRYMNTGVFVPARRQPFVLKTHPCSGVGVGTCDCIDHGETYTCDSVPTLSVRDTFNQGTRCVVGILCH